MFLKKLTGWEVGERDLSKTLSFALSFKLLLLCLELVGSGDEIRQFQLTDRVDYLRCVRVLDPCFRCIFW